MVVFSALIYHIKIILNVNINLIFIILISINIINIFMTFLDPSNTLYNSIIVYIIIIIIFIIKKPEFIYCHKTKKFKSFGCNDGQTVLSLPILSIISAIIIYMIFYFMEYLNEKFL